MSGYLVRVTGHNAKSDHRRELSVRIQLPGKAVAVRPELLVRLAAEDLVERLRSGRFELESIRVEDVDWGSDEPTRP